MPPIEKHSLLPPVHPGEILLEEFLNPLDISQQQISNDIVVPKICIDDIVHCRRGITADLAVRLSAYFGNSAEFWMNLQVGYDLEIAKQFVDVSVIPTLQRQNRKAFGSI